MTVHYKNKRINRAVLAGIFLAAAGLLWGIRDVSAGTEVEVEGQAAGGIFFYDTETERNIYLTRNLYFKYGYTSNSITQGHVTAVLNGATYNPANGSYEIGRVIAPGVYNFHLTYSVSGSEKSDPICWSAWIGYRDYQHTVYIYDCQLPYVKISYGQTINGTITVSDVGQSIKLEAVSGYDQTFYYGIQFPQKLVARAIKSDGQLVSGKQVVFSLKSGPQFGQAAFTTPSAITGSDGTVETSFTLSGPGYYPYTISAYCADCPLQQEALFTETLVAKTHVLQKLPDGDNQTWLVGGTLPKQLSVKVVDSQNNPVDGADIRFSVSAPQQGDWSFPGNVKEITIKTDQGLAKTDFKLGTAAGDYTVDATCAICAAGNNSVSFTATALTNTQATELKKISGDDTGEPGKNLLNPVIVQAVNHITNEKVEGVNVGFSVVTTPPESVGAEISPADIQTDVFGMAEAVATLGNTNGAYIFRAECNACEYNKTVDFNVNTGIPPDTDYSGKEPPYSKFDPPADPDNEIGELEVFFKSRSVFKKVDTNIIAGRSRQRIGILKGDSVVFRAVPAPNKPAESEFEWTSGEPTGNGTSPEIAVTFNSVGDINQNIHVRNKSKTVTVTVKDLSTVIHWDEFWRERPLEKAQCGFFALKAAVAAKTLYGDTWRNGIGDAFRHSYWTALIANEYQDEAFGFSVTESYETKGLANVNPRPLYPNETVMDLENDAVGAYYGAHTPKSTLESMLLIITELISNGEFTVLDSLQNRQLEGLLEKY